MYCVRETTHTELTAIRQKIREKHLCAYTTAYQFSHRRHTQSLGLGMPYRRERTQKKKKQKRYLTLKFQIIFPIFLVHCQQHYGEEVYFFYHFLFLRFQISTEDSDTHTAHNDQKYIIILDRVRLCSALNCAQV